MLAFPEILLIEFQSKSVLLLTRFEGSFSQKQKKKTKNFIPVAGLLYMIKKRSNFVNQVQSMVSCITSK